MHSALARRRGEVVNITILSTASGCQCSQPGRQLSFNVVAHLPEGLQSLGLSAFNGRRIGKAPVDAPRWAGEQRACLSGVVADGDHVVERLRQVLVQMLRTVG